MLRGEQTLNSSYQGDETTTNGVPLLFLKYCWSLFINLFGCAGSLLLRRPFSNCEERELLSTCGAWASHCSGFSCGAWAFRCGGFRSSKFGAYGLRSPIRDRTWCLLHWQGFFTTEPPGKPSLIVFRLQGNGLFPFMTLVSSNNFYYVSIFLLDFLPTKDSI